MVLDWPSIKDHIYLKEKNYTEDLTLKEIFAEFKNTYADKKKLY
jgi:hypothetical protein